MTLACYVGITPAGDLDFIPSKSYARLLSMACRRLALSDEAMTDFHWLASLDRLEMRCSPNAAVAFTLEGLEEDEQLPVTATWMYDRIRISGEGADVWP